MRKFLLLLSLAAWSFQGTIVVALPSGISGRTLKNTTAGCGGSGCHGSGPASGITVTITGPDTVLAGQSASFTVTVTGSSGSNGGVDIAALSGTLAAVSTTLKSLNGDLVHKQRVSVPSTYLFTYTAPASPGSDTLYANGKDNRFSGWTWAANRPVTILTATSVDDPSGTPSSFALRQNYPNPFNPATRIEYALPRAAQVTLRVYDLSGREVATLINGMQGAGLHTVEFDATGLSGGVYFCRMTTDGFTSTRKLALVK